MIHQYKVRPTLFERISFAFIAAIPGRLLLLAGAGSFRGTRCIRVVFVIPKARALVAEHDVLFNLVVINRHPRNKHTRVGARSEVMDVEPDTANTLRKVGVISGLVGRMIAVVVLHTVLFFAVYVPFVALRIVLWVVLVMINDGVQQFALLEALRMIPAHQRFVHVTFKLNGLPADISKEFHNQLMFRNTISQSLDNMGANFIRFD